MEITYQGDPYLLIDLLDLRFTKSDLKTLALSYGAANKIAPERKYLKHPPIKQTNLKLAYLGYVASLFKSYLLFHQPVIKALPDDVKTFTDDSQTNQALFKTLTDAFNGAYEAQRDKPRSFRRFKDLTDHDKTQLNLQFKQIIQNYLKHNVDIQTQITQHDLFIFNNLAFVQYDYLRHLNIPINQLKFEEGGTDEIKNWNQNLLF